MTTENTQILSESVNSIMVRYLKFSFFQQKLIYAINKKRTQTLSLYSRTGVNWLNNNTKNIFYQNRFLILHLCIQALVCNIAIGILSLHESICSTKAITKQPEKKQYTFAESHSDCANDTILQFLESMNNQPLPN